MKRVGVVLALLAVSGLGWLGTRLPPRPFAPYPAPPTAPATVPLREGLPPPVERYYRRLYGDEVPLISSAVVSGRASMRPFGFTLPARFRFTYDAGRGYRHYIEMTFFGLPVARVDEWYLDGHGRLELPVLGVVEGPQTDQGANLGMWAETSYMPALLVTDSRVRWQAVDEETALLIVPFGAAEQRFVARFDPETGGLSSLEAMRYRDEVGPKYLWIAAAVPGPTIAAGGAELGATGSATWLDQGRPWAIFTVEEIVYNVDVQDYIRARGP